MTDELIRLRGAARWVSPLRKTAVPFVHLRVQLYSQIRYIWCHRIAARNWARERARRRQEDADALEPDDPSYAWPRYWREHEALLDNNNSILSRLLEVEASR